MVGINKKKYMVIGIFDDKSIKSAVKKGRQGNPNHLAILNIPYHQLSYLPNIHKNKMHSGSADRGQLKKLVCKQG